MTKASSIGTGASGVFDNLATSIDDYAIRYWYKPEGPRHAAVRGAGLAGFTTIFYYDALQRPIALYNRPGVNIGLAYNRAGQIVERGRDNDSHAWTGAYNVSRPYSVNGLNQYIAAGPAAFAYDANGNLTSDGSTGFVYDSENRLVSASGARNAALAYDPLGRLWQISSGSGTTRFVYDGDRLTEEYDGWGGWLRAYIHGPGTDEPLVWYEFTAGFNRYFLHADHQGSIVALADLNGNATTINGYDAWGIPNPGNQGRFQYTGQAWLAELGMYYYKARIYSPTLGRFLQTDPVGYKDQVNLYAYVGNDPVNKFDSQGEWSRDVHNRIFERALSGRVTAAGIRQMQNVSLHQDIGPNGNRMYMHYLRLPGQDTGSASRQFRSYLTRELAAAGEEYKKGNEDAAINGFARAAHAIADYYSPAHRDNGQPAEYDPDWNPVEAAMNGHSPLDSVGREGTADLTPETESRIVRETEKAADRVFGPEKKQLVVCTGSRIMRTQC